MLTLQFVSHGEQVGSSVSPAEYCDVVGAANIFILNPKSVKKRSESASVRRLLFCFNKKEKDMR